jgi:hypothetical protein
MTDPRYPIGRFEWHKYHTPEERLRDIEVIGDTPQRLRLAVKGLTDEQLDTPYRDGGWTVRQVVHHLADSHLNAFVRMKLALTEDSPMVKPYDEARWANLTDAREAPIWSSLVMLEAMHERWIFMLRAMTAKDFERVFRHPEHAEPRSLDWLVAMYAWHGQHHVAHITTLRQRNGW